ncbi:flagellar basal-body rod protein FlgF [Desulfomarina profundi]|uniref:Flagellar basal-body rod protein FlgF n=1 Tax=Desulfomarina profundi TaxID=2772557 RepID=A0A8D5JD50_9BACT|nr:flagellar basal-body rod protein FlgF [Desulfomarina profundi]BCL60588.1 flagellar basal-body rod protein FlgF [Desulfomarina profundi]
MVSGKYAALAGAISREQSIANISANLANISTTGFKKSTVSFEAILKGEQQANSAKGINYDRIKKNYIDFTPGPMKPTENPLDIAINGSGFFKVQGRDGILYTRRGDFQINEEGLLTTSNGLKVLDEAGAEITIPDTDTSSIGVGNSGTIFILGPRGSRAEVAKLAIVDVDDTSKLKREPDTTFSLQNGGNEIPAENYRVLQGRLELSNVNMATEMAKLIDNQRTFETYHKVLKSYSTIGEKLEELGTVG